MKRSNLQRLRSHKHFKLHLTVAIVAMAALLVQTALMLVSNAVSGALPSAEAAERWGGDGSRYAQISCYFNENAYFDKYSMQNACEAVDRLLTENAMAAAPGARLWIYAYSTETKVNVMGPRDSISAQAILTGGDFFRFHALPLVSGSYYGEGLITDTQLVIDENAAWRLFGSADVVGMRAEIGGYEFTVTGVVESEDGSAAPKLYLPMSAYCRFSGDRNITCFELLLPNPVSGFAHSIATRCVSGEEKYLDIVDHAARFGLMDLYRYLGGFEQVLIPEKQVFYPAWEQNERKVEFSLAMLAILRTVCFAAIAVCAAIELVMLYRAKDGIFAAVKNHAVDTKDRLQEKKWIADRKRREERERKKTLRAEKSAPETVGVLPASEEQHHAAEKAGKRQEKQEAKAAKRQAKAEKKLLREARKILKKQERAEKAAAKQAAKSKKAPQAADGDEKADAEKQTAAGAADRMEL